LVAALGTVARVLTTACAVKKKVEQNRRCAFVSYRDGSKYMSESQFSESQFSLSRIWAAISMIAVVAALCWPADQASAQTPAADSAAGPALELTAAQKQTIYQSVSATQKNNPAPTGFRAAVGAQVPDAIELQPISATLATLIPETADHEVAMVEKQVVLVDPKSKRVVAVVVAE
jgi:hypothetical protein